ncbi:putative serine carboxypeptidase [Venturia nashicola]|nr:putative serine carboxypeptidase [Venturia nashicola]
MASPTDATNHDNDDENEQYPRPETTKRQKHGEEVEIMGASTSKASLGSKESPIILDGEEDPVWMAQPDPASSRLGRTYGSRLQESRPRKPVKLDDDQVIAGGKSKASKGDGKTSKNTLLRKDLGKSREAKSLDSSLRSVDLSRDGSSLSTSGRRSDLETDFTTKKAPAANGVATSALFDPVSTTSTTIEDHITGAATYANMHATEKSRVRLPGLKNFTSSESNGPPGLKVRPGNSTGHAFESSTPSLNRTLVHAAGRKSPTLVDYDSPESSESESDAERPDGLLNSCNNGLDAVQYALLQPTRDAPSSPPLSCSATKSNVIELDKSDEDAVSGCASVYSVLPENVFAQVHEEFKECRREQVYEGCYQSGGGVSLISPEAVAPLTPVTSNGGEEKDKQNDSDGDETMDTPPSQEDDEEYIEVPEGSIRFEVCEYENPDHSCFLILPLDIPYHVFRTRVAIGLGRTGVSGATMNYFWAIRDATSRIRKAQYEIDGDSLYEYLEWMARNTPKDDDTSVVRIFVLNQAFETPEYMSKKDKVREQDRIDEEMSKFRVPQIFGGERPEREESQVVPLDALPLDEIGSDVAR